MVKWKTYGFKLPLFIVLLAALNGCGDDQSAEQDSDSPTAAEQTTDNTESTTAEPPDQAVTEPAPETETGSLPPADNEDGAAPSASPDEATVADTQAVPEYQVECDAEGRNCRVDAETFIGWRMYRSQCAQCHGQDAKGSTFAPSLLTRLNQRVDYPRFVDVVTNGYRGQMGVMPAWKDNNAVMDKIPHMYRYLKARADGELPSGRPEQME